MKSTRLYLVMMTFFIASKVFAVGGDIIGNGGDILVCNYPSGMKYQALDYRMAIDRGIIPQFKGSDILEMTRNMLKPLEKFSPRLHSRILTRSENFASDLVLFQKYQEELLRNPSRERIQEILGGLNKSSFSIIFVDGELLDVHDSGHIYVPRDCELQQMVIRRKKPELLGPVRPENFHVPVLDLALLDFEQMVTLSVHEGIYGELADNHNHGDATSTRALFALLASGSFDKISLNEYKNILTRLEVKPEYADIQISGHSLQLDSEFDPQTNSFSGQLSYPQTFMIGNSNVVLKGNILVENGRVALGHPVTAVDKSEFTEESSSRETPLKIYRKNENNEFRSTDIAIRENEGKVEIAYFSFLVPREGKSLFEITEVDRAFAAEEPICWLNQLAGQEFCFRNGVLTLNAKSLKPEKFDYRLRKFDHKPNNFAKYRVKLGDGKSYEVTNPVDDADSNTYTFPQNPSRKANIEGSSANLNLPNFRTDNPTIKKQSEKDPRKTRQRRKNFRRT